MRHNKYDAITEAAVYCKTRFINGNGSRDRIEIYLDKNG
jgi:hypothetical protein